MLEVTAVKSMLESGNATLADIARHFEVPLSEAVEFARHNGLDDATLEQHPAARLVGITSDQSADRWERLLWDDDEGFVINGIDVARSDGNVNANEICRYYHGELRCMFSHKPTETVMAADSNPNNFLISNLIPICEDVVEKRFRQTPPIIVDREFRFRGITLNVTTDMRFDYSTGCGANEALVAKQVEHWVGSYLNHFDPKEILASGSLPYTNELLSVWIWRRLETKALLKGLARVKVKTDDNLPTAFLTKQAILYQTKQMLQRQMSRRNIVQPAKRPPQSSIIKL